MSLPGVAKLLGLLHHQYAFKRDGQDRDSGLNAAVEPLEDAVSALSGSSKAVNVTGRNYNRQTDGRLCFTNRRSTEQELAS